MKRVCFVANKYPNIIDPNGLVFLQQLVWEFANQGINCSVICPVQINVYPKLRKLSNHMVEITDKNVKIDLYFPKYIGFGQSKKIFGKSMALLTTTLFTHSIKKCIDKYNLKFDIFYGHFITPAGIASVDLGNYYSIPSFIAYGESTLWSIEQYGIERVRNKLKGVSGIISVSTENKDILINNCIVPNSKIRVFPNGYNPKRFFKIDKNLSRNKFGWNNNDFIVGFCGSFDDRKGILRVEAAVDEINNDNVKFACAGKGKLIPTSNKCILKEPVNNDNLVYFYNAIDVFVLPTQNEGCCNAIIEAMACGCPIISSNKKFNYDILDNSNSILIDPNSVEDIRNAIVKIKENKQLRNKLQNGSLNKSKELILENRAKKIINYIFK